MILNRLRETYWQPFNTLSLQVLLLSVVFVFVGFVCSRALLSIGMAGIAVAALLNYKNFALGNYIKRKELLLLTFLFWSVFFSGFWGQFNAEWKNFTRIHLPYLFLPLAFGSLPFLNNRQFKSISFVFLTVMSISGFVVLVNYLANYTAITDSLLSGATIPMPFSHIRYSLMLVFAFCIAMYFIEDGIAVKLIALFLFVLLHVLSVRSGLVALYVSVFIILIFWTLRENKWRQGVAFLSAAFILGSAALMLFPSLKNRISYMTYDVVSFKSATTIDASDGMRFRSWKAAFEVAKTSPIIGVGYGNLQNKMKSYYEKDFPTLHQDQHKLPHNQFLWWMVSIGWLGVTISLFAVLYPFFKYFKSGCWLWHCFNAIILSSFIWEATMEEQMGTGFFLVWLLLTLQHISVKHEA